MKTETKIQLFYIINIHESFVRSSQIDDEENSGDVGCTYLLTGKCVHVQYAPTVHRRQYSKT